MEYLKKASIPEALNLRSEVEILKGTFQNSKIERIKFLKHPFKYLNEKFKITLINKYIKNWKPLIHDFNEAVKNLFKKLIDVIDNCFACILATIILIYGLLAKASLPLIALTHNIHIIIASLEAVFDQRPKGIEKLINLLKDCSPEQMARAFCEFFGMCQKTGAIKIGF